MGNVSSKAGDEGQLVLRDQSRFSISNVSITNSRGRTILNITPNAYPATRFSAKRDLGDDAVIDYVQDPEATPAALPTFLLRLSNDDEININFTFIVRQEQSPGSADGENPTAPTDTNINGLTYIFGSSLKELDNLVTREFHADPNLHKNSNVQLIGDYSTSNSSSVQFTWSWKWRPPKPVEEKGGGWRTCCSFVEYNQRAHRLDSLATFTFWVQNQRPLGSPKILSPRLDIGVPPRLRVPSAQSVESRLSDSDPGETKEQLPPLSPTIEAIPEDGLGILPVSTTSTVGGPNAVKVDVACQRPGGDVSAVEDGPLFRATMKAMEQRTGSMRTRWKKVLKRAEASHEAQGSCNEAIAALIEALKDVSSSNANAVQPAIEHYFDKIAREILAYEKQNTVNLQKMIIDPINKLYNVDIKQADSKKKDFDDESREYYSYVGRYLGQRSDSLKEKKRVETDSKYQSKRRNFELKRFDYSSFMQDLHGGRKDQEVLSQLTRYAVAQTRGYLAAAKKIEAMLPQLDALTHEVQEAAKEYQLQRTEREEKRRALEKSSTAYREPEYPTTAPASSTQTSAPNGRSAIASDSEATLRSEATVAKTTRSASTSQMTAALAIASNGQMDGPQTNKAAALSASPNDKFKGYRDLEEKDYTQPRDGEGSATLHKKEGLLWALSRPGSHVDPKGLNKQAWHKFWIVLDQGKLTEYTNWKQKLDLHMDPIDLRVASVREARNAERRFCFEVITPSFTRVYQATSEEDMKNWISAINNALQTAFERRAPSESPSTDSLPNSTRRDIASVLTGKSPSISGHRISHSSSNKMVSRHATVNDRPSSSRPTDPAAADANAVKLLNQIRETDAGNKFCADCGTETRVEWASINLGIIICIECSGIHRSLGTHITKIRSVTLDPSSFTPDVVELILTIGNRVSNMIWESRPVDTIPKPLPTSTREQRLKYITAKYVDRALVTPISRTLSHFPTPDDTLLASVKQNDINHVLYALAVRANPNATDRSRNTHVVYLALAAADPASPADTSSPSSTPPPPSTGPRKAFPLAELLLLNGASLPTTPPPFPLSGPAKMYLDAKRERENLSQRGGDTVTALPMISREGVTERGLKRGSMGPLGSKDRRVF
ncbi:ArfGap-domain-containing protein [Eremomyces bilateralis CBS 781.70]|uniref:ADP-ribosylation factor GTPase-activating protein n=1 Tax=Eremomyces bilateralis CBS 781.70 TaxID=1392243 RepID=A0A6G1GC49_9PEZI|nr:ArfGap-domain-containing protein [Eremomyces bilateralis CBS 781.70]KAF1815506.1 ArfGap-domain-containing protein [Eremomyces bilateralis CBS 781.70]